MGKRTDIYDILERIVTTSHVVTAGKSLLKIANSKINSIISISIIIL